MGSSSRKARVDVQQQGREQEQEQEQLQGLDGSGGKGRPESKSKRSKVASDHLRSDGHPVFRFTGTTLAEVLDAGEDGHRVKKYVQEYCAKRGFPSAVPKLKTLIGKLHLIPAVVLHCPLTAKNYSEAITRNFKTSTIRNFKDTWLKLLDMLHHKEFFNLYRISGKLVISAEVKEVFHKLGDKRGSSVAMQETKELVHRNSCLVLYPQALCDYLATMQHNWVRMLPLVLSQLEKQVQLLATRGPDEFDRSVLADLACLIQSGIQIFLPTQRIEVLQNLRLGQIQKNPKGGLYHDFSCPTNNPIESMRTVLILPDSQGMLLCLRGCMTRELWACA